MDNNNSSINNNTSVISDSENIIFHTYNYRTTQVKEYVDSMLCDLMLFYPELRGVDLLYRNLGDNYEPMQDILRYVNIDVYTFTDNNEYNEEHIDRIHIHIPYSLKAIYLYKYITVALERWYFHTTAVEFERRRSNNMKNFNIDMVNIISKGYPLQNNVNTLYVFALDEPSVFSESNPMYNMFFGKYIDDIARGLEREHINRYISCCVYIDDIRNNPNIKVRRDQMLGREFFYDLNGEFYYDFGVDTEIRGEIPNSGDNVPVDESVIVDVGAITDSLETVDIPNNINQHDDFMLIAITYSLETVDIPNNINQHDDFMLIAYYESVFADELINIARRDDPHTPTNNNTPDNDAVNNEVRSVVRNVIEDFNEVATNEDAATNEENMDDDDYIDEEMFEPEPSSVYQGECPVCYETTEVGTYYMCNHGVCSSCFINWHNQSHDTCPMCRSFSIFR
jgi:hypothetical protein